MDSLLRSNHNQLPHNKSNTNINVFMQLYLSGRGASYTLHLSDIYHIQSILETNIIILILQMLSLEVTYEYTT